MVTGGRPAMADSDVECMQLTHGYGWINVLLSGREFAILYIKVGRKYTVIVPYYIVLRINHIMCRCDPICFIYIYWH